MKTNFESKMFRYWPLKKYDAITLPWGIYFKASQANVQPSLLKHEMVHVAQIEKYSMPGFYCLYLFYYLKGLIKYKSHALAYRNNPLELEAYEKQNG